MKQFTLTLLGHSEKPQSSDCLSDAAQVTGYIFILFVVHNSTDHDTDMKHRILHTAGLHNTSLNVLSVGCPPLIYRGESKQTCFSKHSSPT